MELKLRENISSIFNILICLCELIGISLMIVNIKYLDMKLFASWVALIGVLASFCYFIKNYINNKIFKYITLVLKYINAGTSLTILFISLCILLPINKGDINNTLINNGNILIVLICPILTLISFIYFESYGDYRLTSALYNCYFVMLYSIIITLLVGFNNLKVPYFIFDYTKYSIFQILMFDVIFIAISYFASAATIKLNYLFHKNYYIEGQILSDKEDEEEIDNNKKVISEEEKALMKEKLKQEILEELKQKENENNLDK